MKEEAIEKIIRGIKKEVSIYYGYDVEVYNCEDIDFICIELLPKREGDSKFSFLLSDDKHTKTLKKAISKTKAILGHQKCPIDPLIAVS